MPKINPGRSDMPSGYSNRVWKGQYCGTAEIAAYAHVTKAAIAHWLKEDWFPPTVDEPAMGRIWNYKEVVEALEKKGYPRGVDPSGKRKPPRRHTLAAAAEAEQQGL